MKRLLFLLLSFITIIASYSQNQQSNAFYVYRNDGGFNAFYYSEVDSITYSTFDIDSIESVNIVVQEIWTADSVWRIPLNVIDSVSFVKPETSYKPNVIRLDDTYIQHVISSDSLSITFDRNLPQQLTPKKNDILLYEGFNELFPDGFVGRVKSVSDDFVIKCDSVEFEDIYEELILLGEYVLQEDRQNTHAYRLASQRIAGEVPLTISVPIKHSIGSIDLEGNANLGIKLRLVIRLQKGLAPYIEMQMKDNETLAIDIHASAKATGFRQIGDKLIGVSVPIPNCPALRLDFATSPFIKPELKGEMSIGAEMESKGQTSYIFDGSKWKTVQMPRINKQKIIFKTGVNGSFWCGVVACIHVATIKNFLSIGTDIYLGPKVSGNIDFNIGDGIVASSMYDALKDTKVDMSLRFESDIALKWRLSKKNSGYTPLFNILPGIELYMGEKYLFPLFTKPTCNVMNTNVDVYSEISRPLLLPCTVGFRLFNNGETIATRYNSKTYWNDDDFSAPLSTTFTGLKYDGKYKVCPMVKILEWEVEATPETEFNNGRCVVYTGNATASFTEAKCWGSVSLNNDVALDSIVDECGFFYNMARTPQNGNATKQTCNMDSDGFFDTTLTGLAEDTQYFYTAFARLGKDYYYGDVLSFKTKKKDNPDPDPNPNPDPDPDPNPDPDPDPDPNPDPDSIPVAVTGSHYDETATTATIECTYENIPAGADCGYYLRGQKGGTIIGSISRSFGNVEGTKAAYLTDLRPASTYYYQAYAQYKGEEYLGVEKSFQTSTPNAVTGEYSDVTSNNATIICGYYDVPSGATTGVKLSYNGQTDELPYSYGEGEHKIDVNNLYPGTSYTYSAYIKFENDYYEGSSKRFTTLTPSAYVGVATEIEEEKAQFEYGFSNVPSGGTCHIALQQEGCETYKYSVSDVKQEVFQLSGLQPSATYTYWSYVEYYGEIWNSNTGSFTTLAPPVPSAVTGDVSDVTDKSANVECAFSNVPNGGVCGVEFTWDGGSTKQACENGDGTKTISLSGLEPNTTYTYCAYIEANGTTYYGEDKNFTTDLPDISGTWTCTEEYYFNWDKNYDNPQYKSYPIVLKEDGTVSIDGKSDYVRSSWGYGSNGKLTIQIMDMATSDFNSGFDINLTADEAKAPKKFTGAINNWSFNSTVGYVSRGGHSVVLTR